MIASRLGLAIAMLLAVVLGVVVLVDRGDDAPASRALAPGFETDKLARLAWSRAGQPDIVLARAGTAWRWTKPLADVPADAAAIDAIVAALRGGRWHRRAALAKAGTLEVTLTAAAGARTLKVGIGDAIAGADQTWLAIGDHAYLVDAWIARALAPEPLALREVRPLRDIAAANTIVIERLEPQPFALRLEGMPRRLVRPAAVYIAPPAIDALHRALAALAIVEVPAKPGRVTTTFTIDAPLLVTVEQRDAGCRDGFVAVSGTYGPGCIASGPWEDVERAIAALRAAPVTLVDPRPLPFDPVTLTLADGGVLDLAKRPRIGDRDADPPRIAELLATLGSPAAPAESSGGIVTATLVATSRANTTVTLELLANKRIRRQGEPVELALGAGAWDVLARASAAYADPTPWTEEPTTIRTITIDTQTFTRGAVVGEWTGAKDGARIEALARMLAKPQVTAAPRPPTKMLHAVSFEVVAPGASPVTHALRLGDRCVALVDTQALALEPALCTAITAAR